MKKVLTVLAIVCLCALVFRACGSCSNKSNNSKIEIEEENDQQSADLDYKSACEELDFGKAHEILDKLRDVFVNEGLPKAQNCQVTSIKGYQAYVDADIYIFREEATYLMGLNDPTAEKRILKLIMETPLDGSHLAEGYCSYNVTSEDMDEGRPVWLFAYCIKRNNQKCDIVLDLSIINESKTLANKVLSCYKDNMHIEQGGRDYSIDGEIKWENVRFKDKTIKVKGKTIKVDNNHGYIWYDSADKDAAQKKYNEAVKDGMFE